MTDMTLLLKCREHRRSIYTEEMAKVVAAILGKEFIQFLAALAILLYAGLFEG